MPRPAIAIIGAGPAGLAFARLLEVSSANINYVIFERDSSPAAPSASGTLDIHATSGQLALREAGLLDEFRRIARYDAPTVITDLSGRVCASFGGDEHKTEAGHEPEIDHSRPEIDRKDLRTLLLRSVPAEKIRWGMRIDHVQREAVESGSDEKSGTLAIYFADGTVERGFRLVVGADGAWSRVRKLLTPALPVYSGIHYLTNTISPSNSIHASSVALASTGNYMAMGRSAQVACQYLADGSYYLAIGLRVPEHWSKDAANADLFTNSAKSSPSSRVQAREALISKYFPSWPALHTDFIRRADEGAAFHAWPLYAMPPDALSWTSVPGVTVIGDAAHVSTPFEGEGVNCALVDSAELARNIIKFGVQEEENLNKAVAEYEEGMFLRGIDLIQRSARNGEVIFREDGAPDGPGGLLETLMGEEGEEGA